MRKSACCRWGIYLLGIMILTCGLTLNTKAALGTSPIISIAYAAANIRGTTLGGASFAEYLVFVAAEIAIHVVTKRERGALIQDLLQIPFSIVFTQFLNLFSANIPSFGEAGLAIQLVVLAAAICLSGIGAALMLAMNLVVNPPDGVVQAVSEVSRMEIETVKNIFDCACLLAAVLFCFLCGSPIMGIGIGTICSMLGAGRVMHLFNRMAKRKLRQWAGLEA